jgi:hypothetical protein
MPRVRDTVLLSGWLFADLLLALAVLFLAMNTSGIRPKPVLPPTLVVSPTILDASANTPDCTGGPLIYQCHVTVQESQASEGPLTWSLTSDISDTIAYSHKIGTLSPGQTTTVEIAALPCQNGSFTFTAHRISDNLAALPVVVSWRCVPPQIKPERLNFRYQSFKIHINDVNAFMSGNSQDNDIRQQIEGQSILSGNSVGLAIVYGGAPDQGSIQQAQDIARKIYNTLGSISQNGFHAFDRASFYVPLYNLGNSLNEVDIDVYFFTH